MSCSAIQNGIQRLLSILLENASKYTPPGGSVTVCARCADSQPSSLSATPAWASAAEHMPRIFDRFYRADPGLRPPSRGSGLGLALAKWIADRHGTKLTVESCPGQGSCFSFSLQTVVPTPHEIAALQPHLDPGAPLILRAVPLIPDPVSSWRPSKGMASHLGEKPGLRCALYQAAS